MLLEYPRSQRAKADLRDNNAQFDRSGPTSVPSGENVPVPDFLLHRSHQSDREFRGKSIEPNAPFLFALALREFKKE